MNLKDTKYMIEFYNRVTDNNIDDVSDIPLNVLDFFMLMMPEHFRYPFIAERLLTGNKGRDENAKHFNCKPSEVRRVGENLGKYKPQYNSAG